jgi:hypothetical protein
MPGLNCGIGCTAAQPVCNASIDGCADFYACQFPAMISDWRDKWNGGGEAIQGRTSGPLPFLFVELAPYTEGVGEPYDRSVAAVREAQLAALSLPNVAMAAAYDYGDPGSPLGNIHPRYKSPVARRLAAAANAVSYSGVAPKHPMNPTFVSATRGSDGRTAVLTFDRPVELRAPARGPCPVALASCAWLSLGGQNATLSTSPSAPTVVTATLPASAPPLPPSSEVAYL